MSSLHVVERHKLYSCDGPPAAQRPEQSMNASACRGVMERWQGLRLAFMRARNAFDLVALITISATTGAAADRTGAPRSTLQREI
jgi:hypothetical protein